MSLSMDVFVRSRRVTRSAWWAAVAVAVVLGGIPGSGTVAQAADGRGSVRAPADASQRERLQALARTFGDWLAAHRTPAYAQLRAGEAAGETVTGAGTNHRIMYLDHGGRPVIYVLHNLDAAKTIAVDALWPGGFSGLSLDGSLDGPREVGLWDDGVVRATHQEIAGRAVWSDTSTTAGLNDHATGVAGTMIAAGVYGQAKGMAPAGSLRVYDFVNDLPEMAAEAADRMRLSNHSYGIGAGWFGYFAPDGSSPALWAWAGDRSVSSTEDYFYGYYDSLTMNLDLLAESAPRYTIVVSAGNERGQGPAADTLHWHWDPADTNAVNGWVQASDHHDVDGGAGGFDCMTGYAVAKNVITVGAIFDRGTPVGADSSDLAPFSSFGPTDDGRVKPDVVANGVDLVTPAAASDASYQSLTGTSQAAPSAAGAVDLLRGYYRRTHGGSDPLASTMKAILVATAQDDASYPGPDYRFGWGVLNAWSASSLVKADSIFGGRIFEATLADGATDRYYLPTHAVGPADSISFSLTLAWTDPAGSPPAPGLDDRTAMLVNDLDLRVTNLATGETWSPWRLDPDNPANAATRGDNTRDNVERIDVYAPLGIGPTFLVTVTHKGTLASSQAYSLVATRALTTNELWTNVTTPEIGALSVWSAAWVDYDGDNDDDLYQARGQSGATWDNRLFRNDGSGPGTDIASGALADAGDGRVCAWADYDNDGDLDVFVGNTGTSRLVRNDAGTFVVEGNNPPDPGFGETHGAAWADYDGDGDVDLFLVRTWDSNQLWRNDCSAGFVDVTTAPLDEYNVTDEDAFWVDYDVDGDPDLYVASPSFASFPNHLFRNDGGSFADMDLYPATNTRSDATAWGDFDNDGDLDLYLGNVLAGPDWLLRNDVSAFVDVTPGWFTASYTNAATWGDFDNDGDLDLLVADDTFGMRYIENLGGGSFSLVASGVLQMVGSNAANGLLTADFDADGDLDAYLAAYGLGALLENGVNNGNAFLGVRLSGSSGGCAGARGPAGGSGANAAAIGARVRVVAGGVTQVRELGGGASGGQDAFTLHFGLGTASFVDTLEVRWPGSGLVETVAGVPAGTTVLVREGEGLATDVAETELPLPLVAEGLRLYPAAPNPFGERGAARLRFSLPAPGGVRLVVYDARGRRVVTLVDGARSSGEHAVEWSGRDASGVPVASGIYFLRLDADGARRTEKVMIVR